LFNATPSLAEATDRAEGDKRTGMVGVLGRSTAS